MSVKTISKDELRRMNGKEGLILQSCGGDPQEWLDGINGLLNDEGILKTCNVLDIFLNISCTRFPRLFTPDLDLVQHTC